jgi:RNA polymerase primary sigma factor
MRSRRTLGQKLNREPTIEEIAAESTIPEKRVVELLDIVEDAVSLETPIPGGDTLYGDLVENETAEGPDTVASEHFRAAELEQALEQLEPRLRELIERRFGLGGHNSQTLDEIGKSLGVTRERVRQLETRALRELRTSAPELAFYLEG